MQQAKQQQQDVCPGCKTVYVYDRELDCWEHNTYHPAEILYDPFNGSKEDSDREVILSICPKCLSVIGICILDDLGATCYTPRPA